MAATLAGSRLTDAHRTAQARVGARTVARLAQVWPLLDLTDLDATAPRWLTAAEGVVLSERQASETLAGEYARVYRSAEMGTTSRTFTPAAGDPLDVRRLRTSLLVTGPVHLKEAMRAGQALLGAADTASATAAASGMRHALNGGRSALINTAKTDPASPGWSRSIGTKPCGFCAMLASRGPVYFSGSFDRSDPRFHGPGTAKVHDSCHCNVEPIYRGDGWTPEARDLADLYDSVRRDLGPGASAKEMRQAFSQALEASRT